MSKSHLLIQTKNTLHQLVNSINLLSYDEYNERIPALSHATIGEHNRHIIELFQQLNDGYNSGIVNYDNRKRDLQLQQNVDFATEALATIIRDLDKPNKELLLTSIFENNVTHIQSNYFREVLYNLEHCIHHQAIIKIGMMQLHLKVTDETFGVSKSTLEYRKQCVQ